MSHMVMTIHDQRKNTTSAEDMAQYPPLPKILRLSKSVKQLAVSNVCKAKLFVQTDVTPFFNVVSTRKNTGAKVCAKRKRRAPGISLDLLHKG